MRVETSDTKWCKKCGLSLKECPPPKYAQGKYSKYYCGTCYWKMIQKKAQHDNI